MLFEKENKNPINDPKTPPLYRLNKTYAFPFNVFALRKSTTDNREIQKNMTNIKKINRQGKSFEILLFQEEKLQNRVNGWQKSRNEGSENKNKDRLKRIKSYSKPKNNRIHQSFLKQNKLWFQIPHVEEGVQNKTDRKIGCFTHQLSRSKKNKKLKKEINFIKLEGSLFSTFLERNKKKQIVQTSKCLTLGNYEEVEEELKQRKSNKIQIKGFKAPKKQVMDHFKLKTTRQTPIIPFNNERIYKSIADYF